MTVVRRLRSEGDADRSRVSRLRSCACSCALISLAALSLCRFIIHGKVYDVNGFLVDHPGQNTRGAEPAYAALRCACSLCLRPLTAPSPFAVSLLLCAAVAVFAGGPEILTNEAGTDATAKFEEVFHSDDARKQLKDFCVGTLKGYTGPANAAMKKKGASGSANATASAGPSSAVYLVAAAAVGALVYLFVL